MFILRQPLYDTLAEYTLEPSTVFNVIIKDDDKDNIVYESEITSSSSGLVAIGWHGTYGESNIPYDFRKYDKTYSIEIWDEDYPVVEDSLVIERPYVDPNTLGTTATEIAEATKNERLARAIVDSITDGFYFKTKDIDTVGQHTDYISLWDKAYKINKVYENSVLVYDSSLATPALDGWNYFITKDKTAITKDPAAGIVGSFNRSESNPVGLSVANSDSISMFDTSDSGNVIAIKPGVLFPAGADYVIEVETGHKVVPYDIKDATKMLIDDIACGKLEYFKRYIKDYSTDQFKISIDKLAFEGTGNLLVDKILNKYIVDIRRPGVL